MQRMAKTFQKKSKLIDLGNHKAAKNATASVDMLIVYDMDFCLKSELAEVYHYGRSVDVIQKTISMRLSGSGGYCGEFTKSIFHWKVIQRLREMDEEP